MQSVDVRNDSIQAESRKRTADTAIEVIDPRMERKLLMTTIAARQVSAGNGDDPMEEGTVSEGHVAAVDALRPGGPVPLEDLSEDDIPWCSFCGDANGGWLKTDKVNQAREVELDWLHHHGFLTFDAESQSAFSTLVQSQAGYCGSTRTEAMTRNRTIEIVWWFVGSVTRENTVARSMQRSCSVRCLLLKGSRCWEA